MDLVMSLADIGFNLFVGFTAWHYWASRDWEVNLDD